MASLPDARQRFVTRQPLSSRSEKMATPAAQTPAIHGSRGRKRAAVVSAAFGPAAAGAGEGGEARSTAVLSGIGSGEPGRSAVGDWEEWEEWEEWEIGGAAA